MSAKKTKRNCIYFTGEASNDVTGSQYHIKYGDSQILLECGLHQSRSNDYLDSYKINSAKFGFKPAEIDYVFVGHCHIDHIGLLPRLVKEGFCGQIIATRETAMVMKPLLLNSCYILGEEARILSKRFGRKYSPLYEEDDVFKTLSLVRIFSEYDVVYKLNNNLSFQWLKNSHCVGAAQIQLLLSDKNEQKKVLYTSDLGSLKSKNHYVKETEIPNFFNDVVIMESTYGDSKRVNSKKRKHDTEHLKIAIDAVLERHGSVILPCFSFSRTQELLTTIYDIYHDAGGFRTKVLVDSKLSCEISKLYFELLEDDDFAKWEKVCSWDNAKFIDEKEDSQKELLDNEPKIILSSSGFCTNGRVVGYLKKYIKDENSMIVFSGYVGDNDSYLSYRIKHYRENKHIKINGELIPNKANCISLASFSSHASHNDLIAYGSSLRTNKLILVHGSEESKKCLREKLKEAISKNNKTYKVITARKGMTIIL